MHPHTYLKNVGDMCTGSGRDGQCDDFMPPQSSFGGIKIKALGLVVSDKIFSCFPYTNVCVYAYVKHVTPEQAHFWPQGHNLSKL